MSAPDIFITLLHCIIRLDKGVGMEQDFIIFAESLAECGKLIRHQYAKHGAAAEI